MTKTMKKTSEEAPTPPEKEERKKYKKLKPPILRQYEMLLAAAARYRAMIPKATDPRESVDILQAALSSIVERDYAYDCGVAAKAEYETAVAFLPLATRLKSLFHIMRAHPADAIKRAQKIKDEADRK